MDYLKRLSELEKSGEISADLKNELQYWRQSYTQAAQATGHSLEECEFHLQRLLDLVVENIRTPFTFDLYHQHLTKPVNYYQFGLDCIRPLIFMEQSSVYGLENVKQIAAYLKKGENAILLANHQTELDPQAISLLLEKSYPQLGEELICVAGHRVISDPLAIPFSKGCNLLCVYSKRYIEDNPDTKEERLMHNQRTMKRMGELLAEGGKCIYVAPSGGRDRPDESGALQVAPFDPQSIEMFGLMAQRSGTPTHFYPLALDTYQLLPPPDTIKKSLGEPRHTCATAIHIAFGQEIDMNSFPGSENANKKERRQIRADFIWQQVNSMYQMMTRRP